MLGVIASVFFGVWMYACSLYFVLRRISLSLSPSRDRFFFLLVQLGWTSLMKAAFAGHVEVVSLLLSAKATVEATNGVHGVDCLLLAVVIYCAVHRVRVCACVYFLSFFNSLFLYFFIFAVQRGETALAFAAKSGRAAVVSALLSAKASVCSTNTVRDRS